MERGKYLKLLWTPQELDFLRENFQHKTNKQLAQELGVGITAVRTRLYEMGFKRMELEYWTEEQVKCLMENYKTKGDKELAEIFNSEFPKNKPWTLKHIEKKRKYLKLKRTKAQLFWIKERHKENGSYALGVQKMWKTRGVTETGDIRLWNNGLKSFAVIKLDDGFVHYNRWLYEDNFGALDSDQLVVTKSGEIIAQSPEDLEIIDRAEHARRNARIRYPHQLKEIVKLIGRVQKEIINH